MIFDLFVLPGFDSEGNEVQHQEEGSGRPEAVDDSEVCRCLLNGNTQIQGSVGSLWSN